MRNNKNHRHYFFPFAYTFNIFTALFMNEKVKKKWMKMNYWHMGRKTTPQDTNIQHAALQQILARKHAQAEAFWAGVQRSIGLKGYANQYKVVLGTSAIILMSSWGIGSSLGGLSASLFSFLTPVTRSL